MFAYKRAPLQRSRHHSQVDEVSPQDKQRARTHPPKKMRHIVFVILLVTTGGLARPRVDSSTRHLQKHYGAPILRSAFKSAAFPRRIHPHEEEGGRRQVRATKDGELKEHDEKTFKNIDTDANGFLSTSELLQFHIDAGYEQAAPFIKVLIEGYDADGNSGLDRREFETRIIDGPETFSYRY